MKDNTNLEELIAAERAKANARIVKLRAAAAAEQKRLDAKVVALLKEHNPEVYAQLSAQARAALNAEKTERSRKAKETVTKPATELATGATATLDNLEQVRQP